MYIVWIKHRNNGKYSLFEWSIDFLAFYTDFINTFIKLSQWFSFVFNLLDIMADNFTYTKQCIANSAKHLLAHMCLKWALFSKSQN